MSQRSRLNCRWYKTSLDCNHMFSVTIMANNEIEATVTYSFLCGIRGFHVYKEVWKPILTERLNLSHERKNLHDRYAILAYEGLAGRLADSIIGHLPREIPRPPRFFLLRGGVAFAEVINTTHRRSPPVQGGLEIPLKVVIEIEATAKNTLIIDKYKELALANYKEPDLNGHFDDCTKDVLKELQDVQEEEMSDSDEESVEVEDK